MLGQPLSMLIPEVVGFRLHGKLPAGATATDLVLTVTQILRKKKVVGKFVEFYGIGTLEPLARRSRDDREHGAGVRRDGRILPGGCGDAQVSAAQRARASIRCGSSRSTARRRGCSGTTTLRIRSSRIRCRSISAPWSRASRARSARRIACRCRASKKVIQRGVERGDGAHRHARGRDRGGEGDGGERADAALAGGGRDGSGRGDGEERQRERDVQRTAVRAQARCGGHRGDHELHEHVESERDARRRTARAEGGRARAQVEAVGEDEPRAGLEGGDGLLREGRRDEVARGARLLSRGLRLHDVHRKLGSAAAAHSSMRSRRRS